MWNPWRGCHRYSEGCKYCYIHKGDAKRGMDTNNIVKSKNFDAPIVKNKNGEYKMKSGKLVYVCFSSDFLIESLFFATFVCRFIWTVVGIICTSKRI